MEEGRTSKRYRWLLISVVIILACWTAAWFGASYYAGSFLDQMIQREAAKGRKWSCGERTITGFPFRMAVLCKNFQYTGLLDGKFATASLGNVRAIAQIYNPRFIIAEADGPLKIKATSQIRQINANWSALRTSIRLTRPIPERLSIQVNNLSADVKLQDRDAQKVTAKSGEFHLRPAPDVTAEIGAMDIAIIVSGLDADILQRLPTGPGPLNTNISARVTKTGLLITGQRRSRLERWRQANGTITIRNSFLRQGSLHIKANGALQIDADRHLAGKINAKAAGMGNLLSRFGLGFASNIKSGIGGLFSRRLSRVDNKSAPDQTTPRKFVPLPLELREGRVWLGPFKTPIRLKRLY